MHFVNTDTRHEPFYVSQYARARMHVFYETTGVFMLE